MQLIEAYSPSISKALGSTLSTGNTHIPNKHLRTFSQVWWCMSVTLALRRPRQEASMYDTVRPCLKKARRVAGEMA